MSDFEIDFSDELIDEFDVPECRPDYKTISVLYMAADKRFIAMPNDEIEKINKEIFSSIKPLLSLANNLIQEYRQNNDGSIRAIKNLYRSAKFFENLSAYELKANRHLFFECKDDAVKEAKELNVFGRLGKYAYCIFNSIIENGYDPNSSAIAQHPVYLQLKQWANEHPAPVVFPFYNITVRDIDYIDANLHMPSFEDCYKKFYLNCTIEIDWNESIDVLI